MQEVEREWMHYNSIPLAHLELIKDSGAVVSDLYQYDGMESSCVAICDDMGFDENGNCWCNWITNIKEVNEEATEDGLCMTVIHCDDDGVLTERIYRISEGLVYISELAMQA